MQSFDLGSATRMLWRIFHPGASLMGSQECAVCAGPADGRFGSQRVMAETFVRYDVFRRPDSLYVCEACAWYLDATGKRTGLDPHPSFQTMSYLISCEGWWREIAREDIGLFIDQYPHGPDSPLWLVLSRQKKKHLILEARPWMPGGRFVAIFEEKGEVDLPLAEFLELRSIIDELLSLGVGKKAIESGRIPPIVLRTEHAARIMGLNRALGRWRPSSAFALAHYIAITPERVSEKAKAA